MSRKEKKKPAALQDIRLDIPEDEIWTYRIEGLQAPQIGIQRDEREQKRYRLKKIGTVLILIVAISISIYFSVRAVSNDTFKYKELEDGTFELVKFSNPGDMTELTLDRTEDGAPISVLREYAFNCEEKLLTVTVGKDVREIDGKTFYSCWNLQNIFVDDENPYYCDLDGVLYNKDMTEVICFPIDHDRYMMEQAGYSEEQPWSDEEYVEKVMTYRVPETVKKIGKLSFNYCQLRVVYLPEGLETIETMAFFKSTSLAKLTAYRGSTEYDSLPDGLTYIGSDAFSYDQELTRVYIPASVTYVGHHAFWDTVYKNGNELCGVTKIEVAAEKDDFHDAVHLGDQWKPQYDYMLFKKSVDVVYGAPRTP